MADDSTRRPTHMATANRTNPGTTEDAQDVSVSRSAAMMSGLVIVSRITGFFRTWCQAFALGVTVTASCYTVANNLPNSLYELVMGGMLVTAFLPVYMSVKDRLGREGASNYASNLTSLVAIIMGAVALLGFAFAAPVVWTQSFSANADFDSNLAVYFFRFFVVEVVLYSLSSIFSGILNAERDYFWSTAAPIFNNIVCSASFVAYALLADTNPGLALVILALGNPLGVLIQVVMQVPSLSRHGVHIRFRVDVHDPAIKETISIGVPSLIVTFATFVTTSVQNSSALSVTASGASVAYYARIWYTLPYSILSIPVTTAMFTELSDRYANKDTAGFVRGVRRGTSQIMFMLVPFMLYLMVFSVPLVRIVGANSLTPSEISMTASYLAVLAISLPVYGVCTYLQKVCSSLRRLGIFAAASCIAAVVQVLVCIVFTPLFGLNVVAISSLFFFVAIDAATFLLLRRWLGHVGMREIARSSAAGLIYGIAGAVAGWLVLQGLQILSPLSGGVLQALLYTAVGGIPAVVVTFALALWRNDPAAGFISGLVGRFFKRA